MSRNNNSSTNRHDGNHERESRAPRDAPSAEPDISLFDDYIAESKDRRDDIRSAAVRSLLFLTLHSRLSDEQVDSLLEATQGVLHSARPASDREALLRIVAWLVLSNRVPEDFLGDFGEGVGKCIDEIVALADADEAGAAFATTMLHTLVVFQALQGNSLMVDEKTALSTRMLDLPVPANRDVAIALLRCLALTANGEDEVPQLAELLQAQLELDDTLARSAELVRVVGLAYEQQGSDFGLEPALFDRFAEASSKAEGGKSAKSDLQAAIRDVVAAMEGKEFEVEKLEFSNQHSLPFEVVIDSLHKQELMVSIRSVVTEPRYYPLISAYSNDFLKAFLGVKVDGLEPQQFVANMQKRSKAREVTYDRLVAGKERKAGRTAARDAKHQSE